MGTTGYFPEENHFNDITANDFKKLDMGGVTALDEGIDHHMIMNKKSGHFAVMTRIHDDICQQPKMLLLGTQMDFTFEQEFPKFCLLTHNYPAD